MPKLENNQQRKITLWLKSEGRNVLELICTTRSDKIWKESLPEYMEESSLIRLRFTRNAIKQFAKITDAY